MWRGIDDDVRLIPGAEEGHTIMTGRLTRVERYVGFGVATLASRSSCVSSRAS